VEVQHRLLKGDPATEILKLAEVEDIALIVMGTHGRTGLSRLLMGSVAEDVVRRATCPAMMIKVPIGTTTS
jgi:nucleotide-binding universal stress UspA family protein